MFGPDDRIATYKIVLGIVILFSIVNHVTREAVRSDAGVALQGYNAFRTKLGASVISTSKVCPYSIQGACVQITEGFAFLLGLTR